MNRQQRMRALEDEARFGAICMEDIAGGTAVRPLTIGGVTFKRGSVLPRDVVMAMAPRNLRAMVVNNFLELTLNRERRPTDAV